MNDKNEVDAAIEELKAEINRKEAVGQNRKGYKVMRKLKAYTYDDMLDGNADVDVEYYQKSEADKVIADLEESHKMEVEQLLMKIAGLEKLVETANKLLKQKGGFMIKDITFDGVKLEGFKKEVTNAVDKSNA